MSLMNPTGPLKILQQDPKHFRIMMWKKGIKRAVGTSEIWMGAVGTKAIPLQCKITRSAVVDLQKKRVIEEDKINCSKRITVFKLMEAHHGSTT